jgi:sarcosine oxidase gamma subunit
VLLFALPDAAKAEAERTARTLGLARMELRDLRAACAALKARGPALLIASSSVKPWDRTVVEEHAERASVPVRWIGPDEWDAVDDTIRTWMAESRRRGRFR